MENIRMPLRELIDTAKERLQELQYAPTTINAFSRYWRELPFLAGPLSSAALSSGARVGGCSGSTLSLVATFSGAACSGAFSGAGGSGAGTSCAGAPSRPASNKLPVRSGLGIFLRAHVQFFVCHVQTSFFMELKKAKPLGSASRKIFPLSI